MKTKTTKNSKNEKTNSKKTADWWLIIVAIVLGVGIMRWNTYKIPAGAAYGPRMMEARVIDSSGSVKEVKYGYPLVYKEKTMVAADSPAQAGFAETSSEQLSLSVCNIVLNIVFWYGVLFTTKTLYKSRKRS